MPRPKNIKRTHRNNNVPTLSPITAFAKHTDHNSIVPNLTVERQKLVNNSTIIEILVQLLCQEKEQQFEKRQKLFHAVSGLIEKCNGSHYLPLEQIHPALTSYCTDLRQHFETLLETAQDQVDKNLDPSHPLRFFIDPSPFQELRISSQQLSGHYLLDNRYGHEFKEEGLLGRGAFGVVTKARNKLDGAIYAVKIIPLRGKSLEKHSKILREVRALAALDHPNIVRYHATWLQCYVLPHHLSEESLYGESNEESQDNQLIWAPQSRGGLPAPEIKQITSYVNTNESTPYDTCNQVLHTSHQFVKPKIKENSISIILEESSEDHNDEDFITTDIPENINSILGSKHAKISRIKTERKSEFSFIKDSKRINNVSMDKSSGSDERSSVSSSYFSHLDKSSSEGNETKIEVSKYRSRSYINNHLKIHKSSKEEIDSCIEFKDNNISLKKEKKSPLLNKSNIKSSSEESSDSFIIFAEKDNSYNSEQASYKDNISLNCDDFSNTSSLYSAESSRNSYKNNEIVFDHFQQSRNPFMNNEDSEQSTLSDLGKDVKPVPTLFIQMGLCGQSLRDWLDKRVEDCVAQRMECLHIVDQNECLGIFYQLLQAINYVHSQNIIHRDIKPANIFFSLNGREVQLGDFGLARPLGAPLPGDIEVLTPHVDHLPNTQGVGTPIYSAPELLMGGVYSYHSDMYSIGLILLELFFPFHTTSERYRVFQSLKTSRSLDSTMHQCWPTVVKLILSLTELDARKRPSAAEVLASSLFDEGIRWQYIMPGMVPSQKVKWQQHSAHSITASLNSIQKSLGKNSCIPFIQSPNNNDNAQESFLSSVEHVSYSNSSEEINSNIISTSVNFENNDLMTEEMLKKNNKKSINNGIECKSYVDQENKPVFNNEKYFSISKENLSKDCWKDQEISQLRLENAQLKEELYHLKEKMQAIKLNSRLPQD